MSPEEKKTKIVLAQIEASGPSGCVLGEIVTAVNKWVADNPEGGLMPVTQSEVEPVVAQLQDQGIVYTGEDGTVRLVEQQ